MESPLSFACLPWYEMPETADALDRLWSAVAERLRDLGVADVPETRTRNPPIPRFLTDPALLIGQCCGYDLVYGFAGSVRPVATPCFRVPGCEGPTYTSFILVRDDVPADDIESLRGRACVINGTNSHSGANALREVVAPLSRDGRFFADVKVSGAHVASLAMVRSGEADVMAIDCVVHGLLTRHRPEALAGTRIIAQSSPVPAPPYVTARATDDATVDLLRRALAEAVAGASDIRDALLLDRVEVLPESAYAAILDVEGKALGHGYTELHAPMVSRR